MKKKYSHIFIYAGMAVLLVFLAFNALTISQISNDLSAKVNEAKQMAEPPKVELTIINSSCKECSSVSDIVSSLKELDIEITKEIALERNSDKSKALIKEYDIERLPAIIVEGETSKLELDGFRQQGSTLLFDSIQAPFEEAFSEEIIGKVSAIIVEDKDCSVCIDFSSFILNLKQNKIFIDDEKKVDYKTEEGQKLISQNNIEKLPTLLLSKDIDKYPAFSQNLKQANLQVKNGFYAIESSAPYTESRTGKLRGIVEVIYLNDENCNDCYDVMIHKQILTRMDIAVEKEEKIEANSPRGTELIQKYKIDKIPTIILQGDLAAYPQVEEMWLTQVGTKEDDGSYVFRELTALGKDIKFRELQ